MKILKSAEQKNVGLIREFYTDEQINDFVEKGVVADFAADIAKIDKNFVGSDNRYRIFTSNISELKVVYDKEYGIYVNIAVMKTGEKLYITL